MSQAGWYPDPGGREGHFRYWDGAHWSASTSTSPAGPPPSTASRPRQGAEPTRQGASGNAPGQEPPAGGQDASPRGGGRSLLLMTLIGVLAVAVIAAGVWALFIRDPGGDDDPLPPRPTRSAWDEVVTPTPTPTPTPTGQSSAPSKSKLCPYTDLSLNDAPPDGRRHGGGLSFADPGTPDWNHHILQMVPWISDTGGVGKVITPIWFSMILVGQLDRTEFGDDPEQAAQQVMSCTASSGMYRGFSGRTDTKAEPMQVSGRDGFRIESDITVNDQGPNIPGDRVVVIALDTGDPTHLAVFMASATLGDAQTNGDVDAAIGSLTVD